MQELLDFLSEFVIVAKFLNQLEMCLNKYGFRQLISNLTFAT